MPAEADYRATAPSRRSNIIRGLSREFDHSTPTSAAARLHALVRGGPKRPLIVSADIDGLVSAAMLRAVSDWQVAALVVKSEKIYVHPEFAEGPFDLTTAFGVDVFSTLFPSVSNHVALWGRRVLQGAEAHTTASYDEAVRARSRDVLMANPSLWVGIEGSYPTNTVRFTSSRYRYPLGTAQFLLALLESASLAPRLFDREYLPWLIANCDGGVESYGRYWFNAPMWWSCMAAAVGPASLSEHLYQLVSQQRPDEFRSVVNKLRSEDPSTAKHLDHKWNLVSTSLDHIRPVLDWITSISGWLDPVLGGAAALKDWVTMTPERGSLDIARMPVGGPDVFRHHLRSSLAAVHTNFNFFETNELGWMLPWAGASAASSTPLPSELLPPGPPAVPLPPDLP